MLKKFEVENFKPFKEKQSGRFAPITLIYGPNSGGKSSIIQAFLMMKQSLGKSERTSEDITLLSSGEYFDAGNVKNCFYKHDTSKPISLQFSFNLPEGIPVKISGDKENNPFLDSFDLSFKFGREKNSRIDKDVEIKASLLNLGFNFISRQGENIPNYKIGFEPMISNKLSDDLKEELSSFYFDYDSSRKHALSLFSDQRIKKDWFSVDKANDLKEYFLVGDKGQLPFILTNSLDDIYELSTELIDQESHIDNWIFPYPINTFNNFVKGIQYIGPLRSIPERFSYYSESKGYDYVGKFGENTPFVLDANKDIQSDLDRWLEKLEMPYRIYPKKIGDIETGDLLFLAVQDLNTFVSLSPKDVGCGISQIIPVLIQGLASSENTIIVEQPELHLHPRMQAQLADFFIENSKSNHENQWIIETHSEITILRMQRRIRQKEISPEDVAVLYVNPTENGSEIIELRMNENGDFLDPWPHGFFDEDIVEIFGEDI